LSTIELSIEPDALVAGAAAKLEPDGAAESDVVDGELSEVADDDVSDVVSVLGKFAGSSRDHPINSALYSAWSSARVFSA
jgi:hypothetical protein